MAMKARYSNKDLCVKALVVFEMQARVGERGRDPDGICYPYVKGLCLAGKENSSTGVASSTPPTSPSGRGWCGEDFLRNKELLAR